MQYRSLGKTGIKVSPYCLGAMMFGKMANADHQDCARIVHRALDFGINFIDTADRYSQGESEAIVGKALKGRRDHVVLATKVFGPMGDDPDSVTEVRGTNGCRGNALPLRVIPELGQVSEYSSEPQGKVPCDVLQQDETGS